MSLLFGKKKKNHVAFNPTNDRFQTWPLLSTRNIRIRLYLHWKDMYVQTCIWAHNRILWVFFFLWKISRWDFSPKLSNVEAIFTFLVIKLLTFNLFIALSQDYALGFFLLFFVLSLKYGKKPMIYAIPKPPFFHMLTPYLWQTEQTTGSYFIFWQCR